MNEKIGNYIPFVMPTSWSRRMPDGKKIPGGSPSIYRVMMVFGVYLPTQEPAQSDESAMNIQIPNINTDDGIWTLIEFKGELNG